MSKTSFTKIIAVLLFCYGVFFVFQNRKIVSIILFEDHAGSYEKHGTVAKKVPEEGGGYLEAYATANSVSPGDFLEVFVSTDQKEVSGKILKWGLQDRPFRRGEIRGTLVRHLGEIGGDRIFVRVKDEWESGVYIVQLESKLIKTNVLFVVRAKVLGSFSNTAVILATNTWQACNPYPNNGRFPAGSFAGSGSRTVVSKVTFNRPYKYSGCAGLPSAFYDYIASLVHFLEKHNYRCEYIVEDDIWDKGMILPYKTLIIGDRAEYVRVYEQDNIARFIKKGNNLIYLNSSPMHRQVKASADGRTLELMWDGKSEETSFFGSKKHLPYGRFYPPSKITGVSLKGPLSAPNMPNLPYTVLDDKHWIYDGTGLKKGDTFGAFGGEGDCSDEYSPQNINILAEAVWDEYEYARHFINQYPDERLSLWYRLGSVLLDLSKVFIRQLLPSPRADMLKTRMIDPLHSELVGAQMVYYQDANLGQVFSSGVLQWCWNMIPMDTLRENPAMSRIFKNLMRRFEVPFKKNKAPAAVTH